MRISDWSSDVCSSDLDLVAERLVDVFQFGHQLARALALGQGQADIAHAVAALGAFDAQPFQPPHPALVARAARFDAFADPNFFLGQRSEEHTPELQSLMPNSYAVFCLKKKKTHHTRNI